MTKPPLLFLDEPTSGLTADGALSVMTVIRNVASAGHAVIRCLLHWLSSPLISSASTIHQPSAEVFEMFDAVLLLQRGGKTVFFGELGRDSQTMTAYLEASGAPPCKPQEARLNMNLIRPGSA